MRTDKDNLIVQFSFEFAKEIISYCQTLQALKHYNLANQLFRSGTSIGANVREAQNAESKADFIHKSKIAAKVADETKYWLMLCDISDGYPEFKALLIKVESIHKIISKIVASSKSSPNHQITKSSN